MGRIYSTPQASGGAFQLAIGVQYTGFEMTRHLKMPDYGGNTQFCHPGVSFKEKRLKGLSQRHQDSSVVSAPNKHWAQCVPPLTQCNGLGATALIYITLC